MTREDVLAKYSQVSMRMGDLVFKLEDLGAKASELKAAMNELRRQKRDLEQALASTSEKEAAKEASSNVVEAAPVQ